MTLAKFRCHKVVSAGKIVDVHRLSAETATLVVEQADGSIEAVECGQAMFSRYTPLIGDQYVLYEPDGYASISPAAVFEEGYSRIDESPAGDLASMARTMADRLAAGVYGNVARAAVVMQLENGLTKTFGWGEDCESNIAMNLFKVAADDLGTYFAPAQPAQAQAPQTLAACDAQKIASDNTTLPKPAIGRIVHYRLSFDDAVAINRRREHARRHISEHAANANGVQVHVGNDVREGETYPMMITNVLGSPHRQHPNSPINGQVMLDGNDLFWATSVWLGEGPGTFSWPQRV